MAPTEAYVKFRERGKKRFNFMMRDGSPTRLKIHAARLPIAAAEAEVEHVKRTQPDLEAIVVPIRVGL